MASYGFSFRASTRVGRYPGRLYLRVVHGCQSRSVTTDYRVFPEEWDAVGRRLLIPYGRSERSRQLAEIESAMLCDLRRMDTVIGKLKKKGGYGIDELMDRYRAVMRGNTLGVFTEKLAAEMEQDGYHRTAKAYRTAAGRLIEFSGNPNLSYEHITPEFVCDFQSSLKADGRSMNTISFYMRTLRAIYHKAIGEGRIHRRAESPFSGVYTGVSTTRKLALSQEELGRLSAFDPTEAVCGEKKKPVELPEHLAPALAMFLFCYHARGMCFIDMAYLKKSALRGDTIHYRRHKTGQAIELRVLPAMRRIIDWFAPLTAASRYLFPVITDPGKELLQYESGLRLQNQRLKKIAALCGIKKRFSTHTARHSWATVAKNAGLPLAVISEGLGHTNQRTTEIYLASLERSILDHASRIVSEAINPGSKSPRGRYRADEGTTGLSGLYRGGYGLRYGTGR